MLRYLILAVLIGLLTGVFFNVYNTTSERKYEKTLKIITDRSDYHLNFIFSKFTEQTGIKIEAIFLDEGTLVNRILERDDQEDIIISLDVVNLEYLKQKKVLKEIRINKDLKIKFNNYYIPYSYRIRVFVVNNNFTSQNPIFYDLIRLHKTCIRPLNHTYNVNLISQILEDRGYEYTKQWLLTLKNNLAIEPQGNDRKQAELVAQGICEIGIINSYYYALMLNSNKKIIAEKLKLIFPEPSYAMLSGIGLTNNKQESRIFLEFMLSPSIQSYIGHSQYEMPNVIGTEIPDISKELLKADIKFIDPEKILDSRPKAMELINSL